MNLKNNKYIYIAIAAAILASIFFIYRNDKIKRYCYEISQYESESVASLRERLVGEDGNLDENLYQKCLEKLR